MCNPLARSAGVFFVAKIGADTAENEQHFAEICQKLATTPDTAASALSFGPRPAGTRGAAGTSGLAADRTPALRRGASRLGPKWLRLKMM